jgi:hypothetical protein
LSTAERVPAQTAMLTIVGQPVEASLGEIRKLTMPAHHDVALPM